MNFARCAAVTLMSFLAIFSDNATASPEEDFWRWFQKNEMSLFDFERDQEPTFDRLAAEMHNVSPSLTFEFGPKEGGRREFVISADGIRAAFPKVESLFAAAPSLPRWKFTKFRPRRAPFDIEYQGLKVKADQVSVLLRSNGAAVGLTVLIPACTSDADKACQGIAFLLLDQALGEYDVETRVGRVAVRAPTPSDTEAVPLRQLPAAFDAQFTKR